MLDGPVTDVAEDLSGTGPWGVRVGRIGSAVVAARSRWRCRIETPDRDRDVLTIRRSGVRFPTRLHYAGGVVGKKDVTGVELPEAQQRQRDPILEVLEQ
jgi:hypothetical protein